MEAFPTGQHKESGDITQVLPCYHGYRILEVNDRASGRIERDKWQSRADESACRCYMYMYMLSDWDQLDEQPDTIENIVQE